MTENQAFKLLCILIVLQGFFSFLNCVEGGMDAGRAVSNGIGFVDILIGALTGYLFGRGK